MHYDWHCLHCSLTDNSGLTNRDSFWKTSNICSCENLSLIKFLDVVAFTQKKSQSKGLIREGIKVFKGPLPRWVRPKRATKGCDWHAKQDTVRQKTCLSVTIQPEGSRPSSGVHRKFSWGGLVQGHMVVICIWCSLFVTSQFDVISMFPNQRFGDVSWHNNAYFSTCTPLISCGIALNIN